MSTPRAATVFAAASVLILAGSVAADAHAHLVRAIPAAGATLEAAPSEVTLRFNEKLERAFSSIVVRDATGKQVDKGEGSVDRADRTTMRVSLQPLQPGMYKVEWRADFGRHPQGERRFHFHDREVAAPAALSVEPGVLELVLVRAVHFAATLSIGGVVCFAAFIAEPVFRSGGHRVPIAGAFRSRLAWIAWTALRLRSRAAWRGSRWRRSR